MTTYQKIVKLILSHEEATRYVPPVGMEVRWSDWDASRKTVIAQFVVSDDISVFYQERKNLDDIEEEIEIKFRGRVLFDYSRNKAMQELLSIQQIDNNGLTGTTDILLDDAVLDQMPKGTKHRLKDEHLEIKNENEIADANSLLEEKTGTTKKLYSNLDKPKQDSDEKSKRLFKVARIEKSGLE